MRRMRREISVEEIERREQSSFPGASDYVHALRYRDIDVDRRKLRPSNPRSTHQLVDFDDVDTYSRVPSRKPNRRRQNL